MPEIRGRLREEVISRAFGCCEYCLIHFQYVTFSHQVDHIIATKHGGADLLSNLAYACAQCNRYKGSDFYSIDPETKEAVPLFNPRSDLWSDHFQLTGPVIEPLTPIGRATARLLQFNQVDRILLRDELILSNRYPFEKT